jgi:hypothetical protein
MNDIVQSVLNSGTTKNISINNGNTTIDSLRLKNDFIPADTTGKSRIAKLLIDAHQQKINVKFNASNVLNSIK